MHLCAHSSTWNTSTRRISVYTVQVFRIAIIPYQWGSSVYGGARRSHSVTATMLAPFPYSWFCSHRHVAPFRTASHRYACKYQGMPPAMVQPTPPTKALLLPRARLFTPFRREALSTLNVHHGFPHLRPHRPTLPPPLLASNFVRRSAQHLSHLLHSRRRLRNRRRVAGKVSLPPTAAKRNHETSQVILHQRFLHYRQLHDHPSAVPRSRNQSGKLTRSNHSAQRNRAPNATLHPGFPRTG